MKKYLLFYIGAVAIVILFFMVAITFREEKNIEKKVFKVEKTSNLLEKKELKEVKKNYNFKLLKKAY
ncbi:hypothetical protein [Sulfurimonas sp.]|uniref:hypothetical protein n=1 Tax=Sulfurimonas sp. TaxID=2022749 RepID=UPI002B48569A|nr:hypothetical protein [Sulfurimonas sp.]